MCIRDSLCRDEAVAFPFAPETKQTFSVTENKQLRNNIKFKSENNNT